MDESLSEYLALCRKFFLPSLTLALSAIASAAISVAIALEGRIGAAGWILASCALISLPPVYRISLRRGHRAGDWGRLVCLLVMSALLAGFVAYRVMALTSIQTCDAHARSWMAEVERVVERRFWQEAEVRFRPQNEEGAIWHTGLVRMIRGPHLHEGDRIRFIGRPMALRHEGGCREWQRNLLLRGIGYLFYLEGRDCTVISSRPSLRDRVRNELARQCDILFNQQTAALVKALYFGNYETIAPITVHAYRRAGVMHILAASGLHVAVVAAVPLLLLAWAGAGKKISLITAASFVVVYVSLTDMPVSLVRASIMFILFVLQRVAGRDAGGTNTLFLAAALVTAIAPGEVYRLGFQLSFGATLGILLFHRRYRSGLSFVPKRIADFFAATIAAQVAVMPIILVRLGELNLAGYAANILVVPLITGMLLTSLAAQVLCAVTGRGLLLGYAVNYMNDCAAWIVERIADLGGHFVVNDLTPALVIAGCLFYVSLLPVPRLRRYTPLAIIAAIAVAWISLAGDRAARPPVTVIRHAHGCVAMARENGTLVIAGRPPRGDARGDLLKKIAAESFASVELVIPVAEHRDVAAYASLARLLPVKRCMIDSRFSMGGAARRLFDALERGGARLEIHDFHAEGRDDSRHNLTAILNACESGRMRGPNKTNEARYLSLQ